ncbi:hypothetical protein EJV46_00380 [Roseococcus sp. SYP-B2431]|uniref:hypothetical protein n=1 Tax=Roseococcus sp. SYP-B2431 TaxID=2496640 RepID=UPI00103B8129|nr:hypothetical protein [Roseococcus sp. SYP-B2431]TCI00949.1 hypothetical protein EJV46_00380 [Roseococcus sp. SYP-B2431]
MTPSRKLMCGLAAVMLTPSIAFAQSSACLQPAEKTAFDIRALQSQLMVVALTCGQQDDYNTFVTRHQRELATAFRNVAGHFRRTAGSQHQRQLDQYITNLANGQSQVGISRGSFFCREQSGLFQQATAAATPVELSQLSVAREVPQAISTQPCPERPGRAATTQTRNQRQQPAASQPRRTASGATPASATR